MNILSINGILALAPAIGMILYFTKRDTQRSEPPKTILFAVFLGIISVIPAIILETLLSPLTKGHSILMYALISGFGVAGLVEESCKYKFVLTWITPRKEFDEVTDGIVYTIAISMGFALFENLMYSLGSPIHVAIIRGVTAIPLHTVASGIMGYYIGQAHFLEKEPAIKLRRKGLIIAIGIHGAYDFFLMTETLLSILTIPLLILSWKFLIKLYNRALLEDRYYGRS